MRRRIYISPEGHLDDVTTQVFTFDVADTEQALYDEELWAQYEAAVAEEGRIYCLVVKALIDEPFDTVELQLAEQSKALIDAGDGDWHDDLDRIEELAIINARAKVR